PIALAFSLLGALVHLFKSANYISAVAVPRIPRRRTITLGAVTVLALMPFLLPNAVSHSRVHGYFEARTSEALTPPAAWAARWVIQAQPFFYPFNEAIRTQLLRGYDFGYNPESRES